MLPLLPSHPVFLSLKSRSQDQHMAIGCRLHLASGIFLLHLKPCAIPPAILDETPVTGYLYFYIREIKMRAKCQIELFVTER